jgi:DNA-binding MarR family transcriptional regulator
MPHIIKTMNEITRCGMQYRTDNLEPFGLKSCHASYLLEICRNPGISQDVLARRICINKSNIARQIVVLEEGGFVERRSSQEDKRVMELYPTEKTLELLPELRKVLGGWSRYLTQDFTEEEIELLAKMLSSMRERAAQWMEEN